MKNVIAFGASNSKNSINKAFATYTVNKLKHVEVQILDLNEFELPLYGIDLEMEKGIPVPAIQFDELLKNCDGIVMSMAEHNGNYTAVFKNLFDWLSRIKSDVPVWKNKPILLLGVSPGRRGAANVLKITGEMFPFFGGNLIATFSLPQFHQNFRNGELIDAEKANELTEKVQQFQNALLDE